MAPVLITQLTPDHYRLRSLREYTCRAVCDILAPAPWPGMADEIDTLRLHLGLDYDAINRRWVEWHDQDYEDGFFACHPAD